MSYIITDHSVNCLQLTQITKLWDEQGNMENELNSLKSLFPDLSEERLCNALESSSYDLNVACSILLSEMEPPSHNEEGQLLELMHMFPALSKDEIRNTLRFKDNNVEDTIHELLCINSLSMEERSAQTEALYDKASSETKTNSNWGGLNDKLSIIMNYGGVPRNVAERLYYEEHFDAIRALIKLMFSYEEIIKEHKQSLQPSNNKKFYSNGNNMTGVGRVQTTHGFAHLKPSKETAAQTVTKPLQFSNEWLQFLSPREYKYEPWDHAAEELDTYIQQNVKFKSINKRFLEKCLEFYNGDVKRTILLLVLIIDKGYSKFTGKYATNSDVSLEFRDTRTKKRSQKNDSPITIKTSTATLSPSSFRDPSIYNKALQMINNILISNTLDFHLFLPEDAELITSRCLDIWWKEEINQRELNAKRLTISKVVQLQPIKIITGRGLHSVGGIPKVRQRIKRFLTNKNFVFEEESSYFVVMGKR